MHRLKFLCFTAFCAAVTTVSGCNDVTDKSNEDMEKLELTTEWDKVFPQSDKVDHSKITFHNRYVAERGFLTIAFDPSFTGESGGQPRAVSSPDINTEDFCAAVDYLSTREDVDPERIGVLGVCGFGGFAVNAAAIDTRIKATVAVTMYDMTRVTAKGYFDENDSADARYEMKRRLNAQRTEDYRNGTYAHAGGNPEVAPADAPQFLKDYVDFYKTKRGYHARSLGSNEGFNTTAALSLINMPILSYADEIRSAVLLVHGENAHSRYFSEDAFKLLTGDNKELLIVPGAVHTDLYDHVDVIPFDKIESFYKEYLK